METKPSSANRWTFGLGTIGRDMVYSLVSMYLVFYLTDILQLPDGTMWWITAIMLVCRVFDALNDPIMGTIVDNTRTKWGKFKPWIAFGAVASGIFTVLLFTDFSLTGAKYVLVFAVLYLFWGMAFTTNDISYWAMMPNLSLDQKEREKIGAIARICANIGMFSLVVGIVPVTNAIGAAVGSMKTAYFILAAAIVVIMLACQLITLLGVKEPRIQIKEQEKTSLKGMLHAIFKNDQLLYTAISMALFMIGYCATTGFGLYYFKYALDNEGMYSVFAAILGVSQLAALSVFPLFSKKFSRKQLYTFATILVVVGYMIFFFAPLKAALGVSMAFIGVAGVLIFVGQAFIQLLMLMFLADSIEYGQWKLKKRNDSVSFALQPFINKMGGAVGSAIVSATIIIAGINSAQSAAEVTEQGLLIMKISMLIIPLILIVIGFIVYYRKYRIDADMYARIIEDLKARGEVASSGEKSES